MAAARGASQQEFGRGATRQKVVRPSGRSRHRSSGESSPPRRGPSHDAAATHALPAVRAGQAVCTPSGPGPRDASGLRQPQSLRLLRPGPTSLGIIARSDPATRGRAAAEWGPSGLHDDVAMWCAPAGTMWTPWRAVRPGGWGAGCGGWRRVKVTRRSDLVRHLHRGQRGGCSASRLLVDGQRVG